VQELRLQPRLEPHIPAAATAVGKHHSNLLESGNHLQT